MTRALVIVDVQNDFVDGSLAVPGGPEVIKPIRAMATKSEWGLIAGTRDWHPADHCSFAKSPLYHDGSWPAHCVQNTHGAMYAEGIQPLLDFSYLKGDDREREEYSGAYARKQDGETVLGNIRRYEIEEVDVVGLALDYCVAATAFDLQREGLKVRVPLAATRAVDPGAGANVIRALRGAGVEVVE